MESKTIIQTIIKTIEQSIDEKTNIKKLSSECFVSPRQLYRDFYSLTGHSVNEYIRKRKLSKALSLIKYSEMSITDIAHLCGYSSAQALCRSIKSSLNISPTEYRNSMDIYYFPIYHGIKTKQIIVKSRTIPQMLCFKFYHSQLTGIENKAVSKLLSVFPEYKGKIFGKNGLQTGNGFCYELYIEDGENCRKAIESSIFGDFIIVPEYTAVFASSSVKNSEDDINAAWDFLYSHWLKNSMFMQDDIPYFEEYIIKGNSVKKLILNLPIKPGEKFCKINLKLYDDRLFVTAAEAGINAEKSASNIVVDFIARRYPFLLKTQKEFYISRTGNLCTCGINTGKSINIPANEIVKTLIIPKGLYAVLEGCCFGSGDEYEQILLGWLRDNGFEAVGTPFSIYDTSQGTNQNEIIVKSQVRLLFPTANRRLPTWLTQ